MSLSSSKHFDGLGLSLSASKSINSHSKTSSNSSHSTSSHSSSLNPDSDSDLDLDDEHASLISQPPVPTEVFSSFKRHLPNSLSLTNTIFQLMEDQSKQGQIEEKELTSIGTKASKDSPTPSVSSASSSSPSPSTQSRPLIQRILLPFTVICSFLAVCLERLCCRRARISDTSFSHDAAFNSKSPSTQPRYFLTDSLSGRVWLRVKALFSSLALYIRREQKWNISEFEAKEFNQIQVSYMIC
jgi:hypothetical protein